MRPFDAKSFPIPVRVIGPGSQPEDDEPLAFMPMPQSMSTFSMPQVPEHADAHALARVRRLLGVLFERMQTWNGGDCTIDIASLDPQATALLNELLGAGEVSVRVRRDTGELRIQETVFAGVWRVLAYASHGTLEGDRLVAGAMPQAVLDAARGAALPLLPPVALPAAAMNSPPLLTEIRDNARRRKLSGGGSAHVINLSLLPLTPEDHQVLNQALPVGPVAIMSKSFGNCRVTSTGTRDVWRVQYFNSMQTMILNTIEIVDVPEVALASADDIADSRARIADLIAWLDESAPQAMS